MARLLAAEGRTGLLHFLEHILVADIGAQHTDSGLAKGNLETHIRHRGGHDGGASQAPAGLQITRRQQENGIAVDDAAICVAEQRAIRISIEGDAQIELPALLSHCLRYYLRMKRAAVFVDVAAIGRRTQKLCLNAATPEEFWRLNTGRAVGAV